MRFSEIKSLININEKWKSFFKGDLLEDIFEYEDIKLFCDILIHEWTPCWKSANKDSIELYDAILSEIEKLNKDILQEEYFMIRELYIYQKHSGNISYTNLEDIINWIDSMFEDYEENEITLELLKNTLDEHIFHYGRDS